MLCPSCGTSNSPGVTYCMEDGMLLPAADAPTGEVEVPRGRLRSVPRGRLRSVPRGRLRSDRAGPDAGREPAPEPQEPPA